MAITCFYPVQRILHQKDINWGKIEGIDSLPENHKARINQFIERYSRVKCWNQGFIGKIAQSNFEKNEKVWNRTQNDRIN